MQPKERKPLAVFLSEHPRAIAVVIPDNELGAQLAHLMRAGCTLAPDAYLFTVIDRAITAEQPKLPKRSYADNLQLCAPDEPGATGMLSA